MRIFIRIITGKTFMFDTEPNDSAESLKRKIQEIEQIPCGQQRLFWDRKPLDSKKPLVDYKIREGDTIYCVNRFYH